MNDLVNHPKHYNSHPSGVECITVTRHMNFNLGNAMKYIWRAGLKSPDPIQDLEKAMFYLRDEIERLRAGAREEIARRLPDPDKKRLEVGVPHNYGNGQTRPLVGGHR